MKTSILFAAIVLGALAPHAAVAQKVDAPAHATEVVSMAAGVVKKLDNDQRKIILQHDALESLGMPPMTMVFHIANESLVEKVKVGDRVMFRAERINGAFVVTALTKLDASP